MAKKPIEDPNNLLHYLFVTHAPLIQKSIRSLKGKGHIPSKDMYGNEIEDWEFHEAGMRGLMEAVTKYDPKIGPFSAYANQSIRGRIQSHADSLHHIPKHIRMQAKGYEKLHGGAPPPEPQTQPAPTQPTPKTETKSTMSNIPDHLKDLVSDEKT